MMAKIRSAAAERAIVLVTGYRPDPFTVETDPYIAAKFVAGIRDGSIGCRIIHPANRYGERPLWLTELLATDPTEPTSAPLPAAILASEATVTLSATETPFPAPTEAEHALMSAASHADFAYREQENYCREHDYFDCTYAHGPAPIIDTTDLPTDDRSAIMARITARAEAKKAVRPDNTDEEIRSFLADMAQQAKALHPSS